MGSIVSRRAMILLFFSTGNRKARFLGVLSALELLQKGGLLKPCLRLRSSKRSSHTFRTILCSTETYGSGGVFGQSRRLLTASGSFSEMSFLIKRTRR